MPPLLVTAEHAASRTRPRHLRKARKLYTCPVSCRTRASTMAAGVCQSARMRYPQSACICIQRSTPVLPDNLRHTRARRAPPKKRRLRAQGGVNLARLLCPLQHRVHTAHSPCPAHPSPRTPPALCMRQEAGYNNMPLLTPALAALVHPCSVLMQRLGVVPADMSRAGYGVTCSTATAPPISLTGLLPTALRRLSRRSASSCTGRDGRTPGGRDSSAPRCRVQQVCIRYTELRRALPHAAAQRAAPLSSTAWPGASLGGADAAACAAAPNYGLAKGPRARAPAACRRRLRQR